MLSFVLVALAGLLLTALIATIGSRADRVALWVGTTGGVSACAIGAVASLIGTLRGAVESKRSTWPTPLGEIHIAVDALSSFFLLCIFVVAGLATIYASGYLQAYIGKRRLAPAVAFYHLLIAAMVGVVIARDGVLFLLAWEMMFVSSYFLVTYENDREEVRRAGITYLIASHVGFVFLTILFALLARVYGSFDFDSFGRTGVAPSGLANGCFLLALVGFGTKAGFWPVHIWLPDAHPAAPSHVSAVMSGVMIKMGVYGLLRTLTFLGHPPAWWGVCLVSIGAVSGIVGVLHALAQHDLKRLLAYHSVENIGIIALGSGIGLLGQAEGNPKIAFLGYAGALLHVLNHGLFKGLLFQGAGSVLHGSGSRDVNILGGLLRRMPVTGWTFLLGSMAICGLPPLNGFVSEWLIYLGAFRGCGAFRTSEGMAAGVSIVALALIGGLATACFAKAFGVVFLGEPRSPAAQRAHDVGPAMNTAMIMCATLCLVIGVWPNGAVALVRHAATVIGKTGPAPADALGALPAISAYAAALVGTILALAILRNALLRGRDLAVSATWGCGYSAPTPRMQYTANSFAEPLLTPFATALHVEIHSEGITGYFPVTGRHEVHLQDIVGERILAPAIKRFLRAVSYLEILQRGRIQLYLVYVIATLIALLVWQFAGPFGS